MFRSYCFCSYSNTAYKSPHFPFLTFPILLVPYFVPPSNLLGTFYIKVNRLENLFTKYGNFSTDNTKISGNISLVFKNSNSDILNQKFSITENGLYFISATQRVTNTVDTSENVKILKNSELITRHDFNIPVINSRRESNVSLSTVIFLTTNDVVTVSRSSCDYICRQRDLFIFKISS